MIGYGIVKSRVIECIILANAFMFILTIAAPKAMLNMFALVPATIFLMPWTILSSMFMHADFTHILFNMLFGVWMFGSYLQRIIGEREFIKVYFLGGIAAGLFYILMSFAAWLPHPMTPAIGASGAVYAVIGALVILRPNMKLYLYFLFPMPLWVFAGLYLLYSVVAIPSGLGGNVAVTAHVGGLIAGLIMGLRYKDDYRPRESYTYVRYY
jgi:hypothetical protein